MLDFCAYGAHLKFLVPSLQVGLLPDVQLADEKLIEYTKGDGTVPINKRNVGSVLKSLLEKHRVLQRVLLVLALIGTCMVIGDGVLTPALSGIGILQYYVCFGSNKV